jgi:hypothetical protein
MLKIVSKTNKLYDILNTENDTIIGSYPFSEIMSACENGYEIGGVFFAE